MRFKDSYGHPMPPESQSRQLDFTVRQQEMPYGYEDAPPAADSGKYDLSKYESKKRYRDYD